MKRKGCVVYETPFAEAFEMAQEKGVCTTPVETSSSPEYKGFTREEEW